MTLTRTNIRFTASGMEAPAVTAEQMHEVVHITIQETVPNLFQMMENAGRNFAVLSMEVIQFGSNVTELKPGGYAVAAVPATGSSFYDKIGMSDMTTDGVYFEYGISHLHGFLNEYCVNDAPYIVKIPQHLKKVAVLMEPLTVGEKGIARAYEIQRSVGRPQRAAVMGAGSIEVLVTLVLRLRGLAVMTFSLARKPNLDADLLEALSARYISTQDMPALAAAQQFGLFDIIFEATGYSPMTFDSMRILGKNGVLVLSSVISGEGKIEVASDKFNLDFVLGNRVTVGTVNANREHFEMGVRNLTHAEAEYPGWLERLLTHPVRGLDKHKERIEKLNNAKGRQKSLRGCTTMKQHVSQARAEH